MLDQARWHMTGKLDIPENISILPLPAKCPELTPTGNVRQFLPDNWMSNRIFKSYGGIVDHCCDGRYGLIAEPWGIGSIRMRDSAYRLQSTRIGTGYSRHLQILRR